MKKTANSFATTILAVCVLSGCVTYGPAGAPGDPYQTGNYYDQYSPAYGYYPGQEGYSPYGYYGYPYPPGYYGAPAIFGPSIYFGFGSWSGSSGVGVGTTFGF